MAVVGTTNAPQALQFPSGRKVARTANGNIWVMANEETGPSTTNYRFWYSTNGGASFSVDLGSAHPTYNGAAGALYVPQGAMFIDQDDYLHAVALDRIDGNLWYVRGTPNAGRTGWTMSSVHQITVGYAGISFYPDIVAHREGTGWVVHIVWTTWNDGSNSNRTWYRPVTITSGGAISVGTAVTISTQGTSIQDTTAPSIDFHHTGDGKTVQGGTPHLYVAYAHTVDSGASGGTYLVRAAYSAGPTWTWGGARNLDSTYAIGSTTGMEWLNCMFDGTRVMVGGVLMTGSGTRRLRLFEIDAANTSSTSLLTSTTAIYYGSASYDARGNIWFAGIVDAPPNAVVYAMWDRTAGALGSTTTVDATSIQNVANVAVKRGFQANRFEFAYLDGTSTPFSITHAGVDTPGLGGPRMMA
jgi:hypothetical protein